MSLRKLKGKLSLKSHDQGGDSARTIAWNTFRTVLTIAKETIDDVPVPGVKAALGGLLAVVDTIETTRGNLEDVKTLTGHLQHIQGDIINPLKEAAAKDAAYMSDALKRLTDKLETDLNSIQETAQNRSSRSRFQRFVSSASDVGVIRQMNRSLDVALQAFQTGTIVSVATRTEETYRVVLSTQSEIVETKNQMLSGRQDGLVTQAAVLRAEAHAISKAQHDLIMALPRSDDARYNSGTRSAAGATSCLPGTRETTLAKIDSWIDSTDPYHPFIFWVSGPAGTGKSTIAQTVAEQQAARGRLGASFCFSRDRASQKDPLLLFPSLAFQLAFFDSGYKHELAKVLEKTPDVGYADVETQSHRLLSLPFWSLSDKGEPLVIIIDALDECEVDSEADKILEAWAGQPEPFEGKIKLLITSRSEDHIYTKFQQLSPPYRYQVHIHHDIGKSPVKEDILAYLRYHLDLIAIRCDVEMPWPKQDVLENLMKRIDALFIWAATAVKFVGDEAWNDPEYQLKVLLDDRGGRASSHVKAIDRLYMTVLRRAIPSDDPALSDRFRTVVGAIALVRDPMSAQILEVFLSLSRGTVLRTLKQLRSVIVVPDGREYPIRVFHQSFPEFLTSPERCNDPRFIIDAPSIHSALANLCLKHLSALRRDICDIRDPTRLNSEVPDLGDRLGRAVSDLLRYACLHFASHLSASSPHDDVFIKFMATFCESKILAWIETLSYLGHLEVVGPALKNLRAWYASTPKPDRLTSELLYDAERLTSQFFDIIRRGAGHIYASALPWAPRSALRKVYDKEVTRFYVLIGQEDQWDTSLCVMEGCNVRFGEGIDVELGGAVAVAIAGGDSGSDVVGLWHTDTGMRMASLITAQNTALVSVSSGDGYIAACSEDWTVHTWDRLSHRLLWSAGPPASLDVEVVSVGAHGLVHIGDSLEDTSSVLSTGPNGQLYEWNAASGQLISSYHGHSEWITCWTVSRQWVVTGSADSTVLVRYLEASAPAPRTRGDQSPDANAVLTLLLRLTHPSPLTNVEFTSLPTSLSNNVAEIASTCASDNLVRLWSPTTGSLNQVIEMPDAVGQMEFFLVGGKMIWSAVGSTRIRILDTETSTHRETWLGHHDHIVSLKASKQKDEVVSASKDGTMRVWKLDQHKYVVESDADEPEPPAQGSIADNTTLPLPSISLRGNRLVLALSETKLRICQLPSGDTLGDLDLKMQDAYQLVDSMTMSPDGDYLVVCPMRYRFAYKEEVCVYTVAELSSPITISVPPGFTVHGTTFSHNGSLLAVLNKAVREKNEPEIHVYETRSTKTIAVITLPPDFSNKSHITFGPRFHLLYHSNWKVYIWDLSAVLAELESNLVVKYSFRDASISSLPLPDEAATKPKRTEPNLVFAPAGETIAHQYVETVVYDRMSMRVLERWPTISRLHRVRSDGSLTFLIIRDAWLWEMNREGERRLCWIPYKLRSSLRNTQWKGPHLVLTPKRGKIVVLDIEALRTHPAA